ncbi:hypothetical protein GCM10022200_20460 [Microbacterium awajiense]|uniref:Phospholipid/glycerol acyltransferase domain-containing protein n=1 Tax=Microbacterium awajiense TaxID=415214 RepID=A0ABP7ANL0_9MICO
MRVPPRWVRRVILAPLVVIAAPVIVLALPTVLVVLLIIASLIPDRFRWPRAIVLVLVYLLWDAALLVVLFALWVASGFGWKLRSHAFVHAHYAVGGFALRVLFWVFGVILRLKITTEAALPSGEPVDVDDVFEAAVPLVVASRHAGPGDSFIVIHTLLNGAGRHSRIVLKDTMQWDPAVDVLLNRIPTRFITPRGFGKGASGGGKAVEAQIADLARGLGRDDALVIFPEGGNATASRRVSRIDRLRASGRDALADRAEGMRHVMPPQPGGVHAALREASEADMVFIAHAGLDSLITVRDIWKALPVDKRVTMHAWRVPRAEIPADAAAQAEWLFGWFERIDAWIDANSD